MEQIGKNKFKNEVFALSKDAVEHSYSFPKTIPKCCGKEMFPCGGVIGIRPDNINGDIEHHWKCNVCKREVCDLLG